MDNQGAPVCVHCGTVMGNDLPNHHCLACLLSFGLKKASVDSEDVKYHAFSSSELAERHSFPREEIDRYRVLVKLGEGGCGVVYQAEQIDPVRRNVALKVIKLGMDSPAVVTRFQVERQALAMMDHPGIARIFDAGMTRSGRPYFAMELVCGAPITSYCQTGRLPLQARLNLFTELCEAVQHAHHKGVIHRDLKPSNVLVVERDGLPHPKVIDFGIAKATARQRLADNTIYTAFDQFIGTPAYMSPEQAGLTGEDVDTRTDVYALGVLLYELLTGVPPFDPERLRTAPIDEVCRTIRDEEPVRPSKLIGRRSLEQPSNFSARQSTDLDWIVMKALEKQPTRRYESASDFGRDVRRFLARETVIARPPTLSYRTGKWVRRHWGAVMSAGLILAALLTALFLSISRYAKEQEARQDAMAAERIALGAAARSRATADFLREMLQSAGPSVALGRDSSLLREILDRAAERVATELKEYPEAEADLCSVLGKTYSDINQLDRAEQLHRRALELRAAVFGPQSDEVAGSHLELAGVLNTRGHKADYLEAETHAQKAVAIRSKLFGPEHLKVADALDILAWSLGVQERQAEVTSASRASLAIKERNLGEDEVALAQPLASLGWQLVGNPDTVAEGELLLRRALRIAVNGLPQGHPFIVEQMRGVTAALITRGQYSEAEASLRKVMEQRIAFYGATNETLPSDLSMLADILRKQKRLVEAEEAAREAVRLQIELRGEDHLFLAKYFYVNLVQVLRDRENWEEAEIIAERWSNLARRLNEEKDLFFALQSLADVQMRLEKWDKAEQTNLERFAICERVSGKSGWAPKECESLKTQIFELRSRSEEIEPKSI